MAELGRHVHRIVAQGKAQAGVEAAQRVRADRPVDRPDVEPVEPLVGAADRGLHPPLDVADALAPPIPVREDRPLAAARTGHMVGQFPAQRLGKIDLPDPGVGLRRSDGQRAARRVEVGPVERADLAVPQPRSGHRRQDRAQPPGGLEQRRQLLGLDGRAAWGRALDAPPSAAGRVAGRVDVAVVAGGVEDHR
ncbi:MAG: hypothetical protein FVQ78_07715 [Solirubrobacterales bacterium]|nr:hypothetical protein [Solirubrobacterales bacterium]